MKIRGIERCFFALIIMYYTRSPSSGWRADDRRLFSIVDEISFHFVFFDQDLTWETINNVEDLDANEISATNDIYVNDYGKRADWIELYNRSQDPVDVAQWLFCVDEKGLDNIKSMQPAK